MNIHPLAGTLPLSNTLIDVPRLVAAFYLSSPDPKMMGERVAFGTSGHRGSSFKKSFNEWHILAITQAICDYRLKNKINGPLFLGIDTHALSFPAMIAAIEVLVANKMDVRLAENDEYTPTPVVSHAILTYNKGRTNGLSDGIVVTPSHNPPSEGGFKYNSPNGGPAGQSVTDEIQNQANKYLENGLNGVKRVSYEEALASPYLKRHNFIDAYVDDLKNVVDMESIRRSRLKLAVDPLGGAGVHYWRKIRDEYGLDLTIINETVDPTFRFMTLDWDGQIRMDPSSPYAMRSLIGLKQYDVAFACDTDHDRHGIVTRSAGLLPANHYQSVAVWYLFQNRPLWKPDLKIGKTIVGTQMIDRIAASLHRDVVEVPVGFKWFVDGLFDGSLGFTSEESAGASFLRFDGSVWTTDKDGMIAALLSAEITAAMGKDPGQVYTDLTVRFGTPVFDRIEGPISLEQKERLKTLSADQIKVTEIGGKKIVSILTKAPGNGASIGGVKVVTENGWFAVRPSGTEPMYKIYAETFGTKEALDQFIKEAQSIVNRALQPD